MERAIFCSVKKGREGGISAGWEMQFPLNLIELWNRESAMGRSTGLDFEPRHMPHTECCRERYYLILLMKILFERVLETGESLELGFHPLPVLFTVSLPPPLSPPTKSKSSSVV